MQIDRPVERVFAFAGRDYIANCQKWSPSTLDIKQTSGGAMGVGTTYRAVRRIQNRPVTISGEVTAYEPNHLLIIRATSEQGKTTSTFTYTPAAEGTDLSLAIEMEGNFPKMLEGRIAKQVGSDTQQDLQTLKGLVEGGAAEPTPVPPEPVAASSATSGPASSVPATLGAASLVAVADGGVIRLGGDSLVGRSPSAPVFIDDQSVSREHARITSADGGYVLEDLGSRNGTLLNGQAVGAPVQLRPGDIITFGVVDYRFSGGQPETAAPAIEVGSAVALQEQPEPVVAPLFTQPPSSPSSSPAPWPPRPAAPEGAGQRGTVASPGGRAMEEEALQSAQHLCALLEQLAIEAREREAEQQRAAVQQQAGQQLQRIVPHLPTRTASRAQVQMLQGLLDALGENPHDTQTQASLRELASQLAEIVDEYAQIRRILDRVAATYDTAPS